jgi:phage anti-repressor protein
VFNKVVEALMQSISRNVKVAMGDGTNMIFVTNVQVLVSSDPKVDFAKKFTTDELMDGSRRLSLFVVLDKQKPTEQNMRAEAQKRDTQGTALSGCLALFGVCSVASVMMFWRFVEDGHDPYDHYFEKDNTDPDVTTFMRAAATYGFGRTDRELQLQMRKEMNMVQKPAAQRKLQWNEFLNDKEEVMLSRSQAFAKMEMVPRNVSHDVIIRM